jgi:hypothetical protein
MKASFWMWIFCKTNSSKIETKRAFNLVGMLIALKCCHLQVDNMIGQYHWHILLCSHPGFSSSQMVWLLSTIWRHVCSTDILLCLTYKTACSFRIWWMICDLEYGHGLEVCSAHNQKVCRLSQSLKIKETHKQDTPVVEKSWPWKYK